jgi:aspartyl-tRNA(Asn)/glutamyl-tRNA(Gln) amidotransferase subunit A
LSIINMNIRQLAEALNKKELSSVDLTKAYLAQINKLEPTINSYIKVTADVALQAAEQSDKRRQEGSVLGILDGIPMALKDIFCTKGVTTTCASKILENFIPPYNATSWQKLEDAGAVLLGKCNMDEFAMGSSTENSAFGITKNPYDTQRIPGGSSGGSAAALAARMAAYTLGTDTGGSVRQPASYCGVVGLKPTYGRISRFGVIPYASSLDQVGIFALDIQDCALILENIAGQDSYDSTSAPQPVGAYQAACQKDVKGLKIGLPQEYLAEGIDSAIIEKVYDAAEKLQKLGAEIIPVSLPHTKYALPAYYILATAEASSNLARYDGVRYGLRVEKDNIQDTFTATRSAGFGKEVKTRIMLGTYALSSGYYDAYYNKTLQARTLIKGDYDQVFTSVQALLTPTAPSTAFKLGEKTADPLAMYMTDVCTVPVNLAGLPGLTVPYTMHNDMPLGLQLIGPAFGEENLFTIGQALENIAGKLPMPKLAEEA